MLERMDGNAISVSQFVTLIDETLLTLGDIVVEGEVSNFQVKSGKWVLFDMKDEECAVSCFMPVWDLKAEIEDGMLVQATGNGRLKKWGQFSFNVRRVVPAGEGALKRAFELLKQRLTEEGLFAQERKRAIARFPEHVALITSRDAAAYKDFVKVLGARIGGIRISFIHSQVQGDDACRQILAALDIANTSLTSVDTIVMVRGGGSLEDLQAFNDEAVVRAVSASRVPIIVGVGHERDVTLAELAADLRASTPSNAAELLVRSRAEILGEIKHLETKLAHSMHERLRHIRVAIDRLSEIMRHTVQSEIERRKQGVESLERMLRSFSPEQVLQRGYSITMNKAGQVVSSRDQVAKDDTLRTRLAKGEIWSKVSRV